MRDPVVAAIINLVPVTAALGFLVTGTNNGAGALLILASLYNLGIRLRG